MFFVKYGNEFLHDPRVGLILQVSEPSVELNSSSEFQFDISKNHPMYSKIREYDVKNPVTVLQDSDIIYKGEIVSIDDDFYSTKTVTCKSDLNYLNHSILRPYSTSDSESTNVVPDTVSGFFEYLINEHNKQSIGSRQFKMGINQGEDLSSRATIYTSSSGYSTIGETILSKIIDNFGGYIRIRHEKDGDYVDLLSDMPGVSTQVIDFGKNLLDYTSSLDSSDICTYVIPVGDVIEHNSLYSGFETYLTIDGSCLDALSEAVDDYYEAYENAYYDWVEAVYYYENLPETATEEEIEAAEKRVEETYDATLSAYNSYEAKEEAYEDAYVNYMDKPLEPGYVKQKDYIFSEKAVEKYGWIGKSVTFDGVTHMSTLISDGLKYLKSYESPIKSIRINAIDLSLIDKNVKPLKLGDYIRVRSKPHNFDSYMLCTSIDYDLNKPENNTFTLGVTFDTLTGQQNKRINTLNSSINTVYEEASKMSDEAKQMAESAQTTVVEVSDRMSEDYSQMQKEVSDNYVRQDTFAEQVVQVVEPDYVSNSFFDNFKNEYDSEVQQTQAAIDNSATKSELSVVQTSVQSTSNRVTDLESYIQFSSATGLILGSDSSQYVANVTPNAFQISQRTSTGLSPVSWLSEQTLYNTNIDVAKDLNIGKTNVDADGHYTFHQESDGTLSLIYLAE